MMPALLDLCFLDERPLDWGPPATGAFTVTIGGVEKDLIRKSLSIDLRIEERTIAQFALYDETAGYHYEQGEAVLIYDQDGDLVFGGIIDVPEEQLVGDGFVHSIRCIDYHYHADKRIAAESYVDTDAGDIARDLLVKYLAPEGITAGTIQDGPEIVSAVVNYVTVSKALDALAEKSGFIWYIDENKELHFEERYTHAAPWIAYSSHMIKGRTKLQHGHRQYRNRQYIRGGRAATDPQVENRTGDGETESFAMGYPLIEAPTVTEDAGGMTVGIKGIDAGKEYYWNKGDNVITAAAAPGIGVALVFSYVGEYNIIAVSYDTIAIADRLAVEGAGTGYVDDMSEDFDANSLEAAFETAAAKLERYAVEGKRLRFDTWRSGLKAGQRLFVFFPPFLDLGFHEMLLESVRVHPDGDNLLYSVVAIEGPVSGSWARYFGSLSTGQLAVDKLTIGEETILIILVEPSDAVDIGDGSVTTVWACPDVGVGLWPELNLYPC